MKEPIEVLGEFLTSVGLKDVVYCCIKADWITRSCIITVEQRVQPAQIANLEILVTTLKQYKFTLEEEYIL